MEVRRAPNSLGEHPNCALPAAAAAEVLRTIFGPSKLRHANCLVIPRERLVWLRPSDRVLRTTPFPAGWVINGLCHCFRRELGHDPAQ
jgi:hypothetical protein